MTTEESVVEAARKWVKFRDLALALRRERDPMECKLEAEEADRFFAGQTNQHGKVTPCWKQTRQTAPDDYEYLPRDEWCTACLKRQEIHERYSEAAASRGAYQRVLIAAVRRLESDGADQ